jgi:alkylation response protein AidB-like acyl-CoA dehydrogenase
MTCDANPVAVTELAPTEEIQELRERYRAFMEQHVYPNERELQSDDADLIRSLRAKAKEEGLWAPHAPKPAARARASSSTRT